MITPRLYAIANIIESVGTPLAVGLAGKIKFKIRNSPQAVDGLIPKLQAHSESIRQRSLTLAQIKSVFDIEAKYDEVLAMIIRSGKLYEQLSQLLSMVQL